MSSEIKPQSEDRKARPRLPDWLRVKSGKRQQSRATHDLVSKWGINTVCECARCPNIGECYSAGTATFMLLGDICTRNCRFCAVQHGEPEPVDADEPERVAEAAAELNLDFVVVTCVTRDDLADGGAGQFADTIHALRDRIDGIAVEVLPSDLNGDLDTLQTILDAEPDVYNHNVETVRALQEAIRPDANYDRSLNMLRAAKAEGFVTKSGLIVGMGERRGQILEAIGDLADAGIDILTIGQYLQPGRRHHPVDRYVHPDEFDEFRLWASEAGIEYAVSGPFVRSSYHAARAAEAVSD